MAFKDYPTSPSAVVTIGGNNVAEGCPARNINNAIRQLASDGRILSDFVDVGIAAAQSGISTVGSTVDRDTFYATEANRTKLVYVNNNNGSGSDPANGVYEYVNGSARIAQGFYIGITAAVQPLINVTSSLLPIVTNGNDNLYDPSRNLNGAYVRSDAVLDQNGDPSWRVARLVVEAGSTYAVYLANGSIAFPVAGVYGPATGDPPYQTALTRIDLVGTSDPNVWTFTVPLGNPLTAYFNVKTTTSFDVSSSFIVRLGTSVPVRPLPYAPAVNMLGGRPIRDEAARQAIAKLVTPVATGRYTGKKVYFFGDSITEGTEGGYVQYAAAPLGCVAVNKGSSGARASRLVGIMTDQPRRDGPTDPFPAVDYSDAAAVSIMIGTNDSFDAGGAAVTGSMSDIPTQSIIDVPYTGAANASAHWQRFVDSFYGNLAMCIEYVLWKNPKARVSLVVSPHIYNNDTKTPQLSRMNAVAAAMKEIGAYYSVPVILGHIESEISAKSKMAYSYDGVHLNVLGNQVWGAFLGYRLLTS